MKIGIIETGAPPPVLRADHGTYDTMTRNFLGASHDYATYRVYDGDLPPAAHGCDGFVITGSACGVKDGLSWVDDLIGFLQKVRGDTRLVGICFGHQVMAQAFGGDVAKAPQGWGLGLHRYDLAARADWMRADWMDGAATVSGMASHQDQVLTLPPRCRVLGASAFTPHAILAYEDHPSISVQFHPEFTAEFSRALLRMRRIAGVDARQVQSAIASLDGPNDNARVARWVDAFLS